VIAHVVLFQPRPSLSALERQALADTFSETVRAIPSVSRARFGPRVLHGAGYEAGTDAGVTHAAVIEFDNVPGLRAYLEHALHERLAARFFAAADRVIVYDFELEEANPNP
jgi:hypothetical protein